MFEDIADKPEDLRKYNRHRPKKRRTLRMSKRKESIRLESKQRQFTGNVRGKV
jgi:hypothetical protein